MAVPQVDQPGLRFPEDLQPQPNMSHEQAMSMLMRAAELAKTVPFQWKYVDKPIEGTIVVYFLQANYSLPQDGIRYLELEQRYTTTFQGGIELEINEQRYGYAPGLNETVAQRLRRRYRVVRGGHPNLFLYHWSRGPGTPVPASAVNAPIRSYPLRQINEPAMYVSGEHKGKRVPVGGLGAGGGAPGQPGQPGQPGVPHQQQVQQGQQQPPPGAHPQQVALAQQNQQMAALEARQRERSASTAQRVGPPPQPRVDEEHDTVDDLEHLSTRTLASARYRRNHEIMNEVFMHAAFGERGFEKQPGAYSVFKKSELEDKISKLQGEIQEMHSKSAARRAARGTPASAAAPTIFDPVLADVSMST